MKPAKPKAFITMPSYTYEAAKSTAFIPMFPYTYEAS